MEEERAGFFYIAKIGLDFARIARYRQQVSQQRRAPRIGYACRMGERGG